MKHRAIVLGLDGLEPSIVEALLERGELANFAKLRRQGSYRRLRTTYPAQTPVAWSSFATGTNPGGHGIFDFIRRDPATYQPDLALTQFERPKSILALPKVVSRRKGIPLWKLLGQAGLPTTVLRCPCTFPPDTDCGKILAGVGVPDLRGGQGTGTFYSQDRGQTAKENEQLVHLESGEQFKTYVIGPRNTRTNPPAEVIADLRVDVDRSARVLKFQTGGTPAGLNLSEKSWSPWIRLKFKISILQSVSGIARIYLKQLDPYVEFYVSPVNFDPAAPLFPVSAPGTYAAEIAEQIGLFSTLGMAEDHTGHNNDRFDANDFLAQCELVFEEREKMMFYELDRFREGFLFTLFDTPDRVQHMFWRFRDPQHPCYDPDLARQLGPKIDELYQRCDRVLGRVMEHADENTLLIVLSDHGFNSFNRAFDTNTWLWQNGLLKLKDGRKPSEEVNGAIDIDWSDTYAYAVGLGGIYLNFRGRENGGIVEEGTEADRVRTAIQAGLSGIIDTGTQRAAVRGVSLKESIYSGPYVADSPDLLVNFMPGFRVSWQSALGNFSHSLFQDNDRFWSGDHIIDPDAVPGTLFMNKAANSDDCSIVDIAPTILKYLGVPPGTAMEGKSLV